MTPAQQAISELADRLDTSPTVNIAENGKLITVTNEQFNHMQVFTIWDIARKYSLTMQVDFTMQRPHPAIVISLTDNNPVKGGERQKDWEQNSFGLTL